MLEVKDLCCKFEDNDVLRGISFTVRDGEIVTIIGGSGAGKTTIIRALCGLETGSHGQIKVNGHRPRSGEYGLVQQGCCLFQHMTILDNVAYALRAVKKYPKQKADLEAQKILRQFGLEEKITCYANSLSGGQKQRVAIARTLVMHPKVLLFDEPTSALDPEMTSDIIGIIKDIASKGISTLIVTHDLLMARRVSHRILFLEGGRIIEDAATEEFFSSPQTARAKSFLRNAACID